jgi:hypothetical protein
MCGILDFKWKYGEGEVLSDLSDHLKNSYGAHYSNESNDVQTLDVFEARGTLADTSIDNAIKYLMRYGKKAGRNKKDLLKAMHYLVLATAFDEKTGVYDEDEKIWEDFKGDFEVNMPMSGREMHPSLNDDYEGIEINEQYKREFEEKG